MEEAYKAKDLGALVLAKAQAEGLTIAEEAVETLAKAVYLGFKEWMVQSAAVSPSKIDDFFVSFYEQLDGFVMPQIAKIDLDKDGK